jgi:spermidine synthase
MRPTVAGDSPSLTTRVQPGAFVVLLVAVTCSGAAGLTYQVLWLRLLSLVFGVTAYAASTVLAGFMAGLAVGSLLAGRVAGRARHPLRLFAAAEVGIALTALVSLPLFATLPSWYAGLHGVIGSDFATMTLMRFVGAFLVLVVPTSMMGATLPLLAASTLVRAQRTAAHVSAVYAANTAGAVVGALVTGMYLIGSIGVSASFFVAAAANLIAAAGAWWVSSSDAPEESSAPIPAPVADPSGPVSDEGSPVRGTALFVLGVSGLASLALEVVWFRILVLFIPATTYAFTTMLAAVLLGIAGGSWIAARLLVRDRDWLAVLTRVQAATAVAIPLSLTVLAWTYGRGWRTSGQIQAAVVAIVPAALLMGVAFPIGLRLWARRGRAPDGREADVARDVGTAYAVNVGGAIAGAILGGFVLLPRLGSRTSLLVCAALYLLCAGVLARHDAHRRRALATLSLATVAFVITAIGVPDPFLATLARRHSPSDRIVWREEGVQTTVSLHQQEGRRYAVFLDGLHQANDSPGMLQTHREIGHLPMLLHPSPGRVLVIGLGGGATSGAVSRHASQVDIVELSSSVRRAAELFSHANYNVLAQPHVRLRVDDGRNYLLTTGERYDVITADIIQPLHAGAGLLYSAEYFKLARNVLNEDGVMLQWVGHRPDRQYRLMVRAFLAAFPHTTLWQGGTLLVGSKRPLAISRSSFERQRRSPATREALDLIGLRTFEDLTALFVAGSAELRAFIGEGDMLTDDRPRLEFHRSLPRGDREIDLSTLLTARRQPPVVD